ncbi:hypothetical protein TGAM01_v207506 [Trichoderma gamsii]|uniref:Uncharacterized protein n=1 Tax=Trichoderma gamsii TaxID=398673 RepID=A0A2P4ZGZ5_9HYPO|nr:hypothetical protein TGAM01_v207506 [Trichoderma gamsii]PON23562.1 hypothetical protein TGAM01_v207506 [Trichoderma gamsii]
MCIRQLAAILSSPLIGKQWASSEVEEGEASQEVLGEAGNRYSKATKAIGAAHPRLGIGLAARVYKHKWPRRRAGKTWLIVTEAEAETWRLEAGFIISANDSEVDSTAK